VLQAHGVGIGELRPVRPQASRTRFVSGGDPDPGVFVKVVVRKWRDTDLIYRAWRWARHAGHPVRQGTPAHEVEHEALAMPAPRRRRPDAGDSARDIIRRATSLPPRRAHSTR